MSAPFRVGDKVHAKGCAFWMTITRARPAGYFACRFGIAGRDAGNWHELELEHVDESRTVERLYAQFDQLHDAHNLGRLHEGDLPQAEASAALRALLPVFNAALYALAKHEGVNPFSLLPQLHASMAQKPAKPETISQPAAQRAPA